MEKYIPFSVPIKKYDDGKTITHKLKFIDSFRLMPASLSNLTDNLSKINKEECKACMNRENIELECNCIEHKSNNLHFKCKECERIWLKP